MEGGEEARERGEGRGRGGGTGGESSMGSRVDEVFIMAPLPGTAISVFIHT